MWMDQREYKIPENWEITRQTRMWTTVFADETDVSSTEIASTSDAQLVTTETSILNVQQSEIQEKEDELNKINVETVRGCWEIPVLSTKTFEYKGNNCTNNKTNFFFAL